MIQLKYSKSIPSTFKSIGFCLTVILLVGFQQVFGPLKLPSIIGDHMVLQQKMNVPIWDGQMQETEYSEVQK